MALMTAEYAYATANLHARHTDTVRKMTIEIDRLSRKNELFNASMQRRRKIASSRTPSSSSRKVSWKLEPLVIPPPPPVSRVTLRTAATTTAKAKANFYDLTPNTLRDSS
jgi:hypothetical protein